MIKKCENRDLQICLLRRADFLRNKKSNFTECIDCARFEQLKKLDRLERERLKMDYRKVNPGEICLETIDSDEIMVYDNYGNLTPFYRKKRLQKYCERCKIHFLTYRPSDRLCKACRRQEKEKRENERRTNRTDETNL